MKQAGIVLETRPLGEADLLASILGRETGRIAAVARGARRSRKRFFSRVDILDCGMCEFSASRKPEQPYTLNAISEKTCWRGLRLNLESLALASYCLETAQNFCALEDPECARLFAPLFLSLRALDRTEKSVERYAVAAYFNLCTLKLGGFSIIEEGRKLDSQAFEWLRQMDSANNPIAPHDLKLAKQGFLLGARYSESIVGRPLKTVEQIRAEL